MPSVLDSLDHYCFKNVKVTSSTTTTGEVSGQVEAELCLDKGIHYPAWLKEGKISAAEYNLWFQTLTPQEKMGYYDRGHRYKIVVPLNAGELKMHEDDLEQFKALLLSKLTARTELFVQNELPQHLAETKVTPITL